MKENVDYGKIQSLIDSIKLRGDFDYGLDELERQGLQRICIDYSIALEELSYEERKLLWSELMDLARENDFTRSFKEFEDEE